MNPIPGQKWATEDSPGEPVVKAALPLLGGAAWIPGRGTKIPHAARPRTNKNPETCSFGASLVARTVKNLPAMWEARVQSLSREDPLEKGMATHSSIPPWEIPWREEPGRPQSKGSQRVRHDWAFLQNPQRNHPTLVFLKLPQWFWASRIAQLVKNLPGSAGKESACNVGDLGSIPGLGRSPGEGRGYPLQYSGLENSMDCIVHGVAKSRTRLSDVHCTCRDSMRTEDYGVEHQENVLYAQTTLWSVWGARNFISSSYYLSDQIRSGQSLSRVRLFETPWIAARQASLSITNSGSSLRLTSIESVMPSSHLILCRPLLLLPPIPPSISLFQWVSSSQEVAKVLEFQL